jgi:hypothetical protein
MLGWFSILAILIMVYSTGARGEPPKLVSVGRIWDRGQHNAFTDLIRFRGEWFCVFREADDHVGGDGKLRVLKSKDGDRWESAALIEEEGIDLRDPKLSVTPGGRLMIVAGGSVYQGTKVLKGRQPRVSFSGDGLQWTPVRRILTEGDWLWRVTWHKGKAYGVSYTLNSAGASAGEDWNTKLYESPDGLKWTLVTTLQVPERPNETTLRFLGNDDCVALVRREAGDKQAWIGVSKPPYKEWRWTPSGSQVGGPNFIVLEGDSMIAGGRLYGPGSNHKTAIGRMTLDGYKPELMLPSSGDNSYPGLVWENGTLWVSYYSTHEGKTSIYLARVRWPGLP